MGVRVGEVYVSKFEQLFAYKMKNNIEFREVGGELTSE